MKDHNCPTCGAKCKVVGKVTKHYEPVGKKSHKEALEYIVSKDFVIAMGSIHAMRKWVREFQEVAREALEEGKE